MSIKVYVCKRDFAWTGRFIRSNGCDTVAGGAYRERLLLEIALVKSGVEKCLTRFSFIRAEAFIPHPFGCNKRYESRLQFLMRTHSAAFTARCVIDNISGDAKKSCVGNVALTRSLQVAHCSELFFKSRVEKRPSRFSFIGDAKKSCAGNVLQRTAGMPCRTFAKQLRIFAKQKYGSERAVSKVGYFFDSLSSLKLSLYIAMT